MMKNQDSRVNVRALGLLGSALFVMAALAVGHQVFAAPSLDLVQIGLQPAQSLPFQYSVVAYNTSGYQVASYGSRYPGAAFQLPAGTYLVTASAYNQNSTYCYECVMGTGAGTASPAVMPPFYKPFGGPYTEYGYAFTQVNGSTSVTIKLQNASAMPLTQLTIRVAYANCIAADGAYVSAYVVGSFYGYSPQMVSYGQTGRSGTVTLTMPQAPIDVSAYLSMPIKLPKNSSSVTVDVGGEKVNVTVSIQPSYLPLYGQTLLVPPQTSGDIVLHYRPFYGPIVYPALYGSTGPMGYATTTTARAPGPSATSGQTQAAIKIAPFNPGELGAAQISSPVAPGSANAYPTSVAALEGIAAGGVLLAAIVLTALWIRKSGSRAPTP